MRASQTQQRAQPLPLPLPLPPPPLCLPSPHVAPRRGRHRSSYSSSSSSSSSVSSAASTFCPSPSPAASPLGRSSTSASSLVPFSWERHPGVPKNSFRSGLASPTGMPLPLPPPLHPAPRRRRRRPRAKASAHASAAADSDASCDPFVAAFAQCTRDDDGEDDEADHGADDAVTTAAKADKLWLAPAKPKVSGGGARPWRSASGGFLGFLDLYGCKSAMEVADGAFLARRPVVAARPGPASGSRARR